MTSRTFFPTTGGYACPSCGAVIKAAHVAAHRCAAGASQSVARAASRADCVYRGEELRREQCPTCAGNVQIKVFACSKHGECSIDKAPAGVRSCGSCRDFVPRPRLSAEGRPFSGGFGRIFAPQPGVPPFITSAQLAADSLALAGALPPNVSRIIGIARSGLVPASMIAQIQHRPLSIYNPETGDMHDTGRGWRTEGAEIPAGPACIVDDNVMTGQSLRTARVALQARFPQLLTAAVYCNKNAATKPDFCVQTIGWPVFLEWNLFNSVYEESLALDFDGILCHDCDAADDDDGPRYLKFIREARPLYYVRRKMIPLIVTARLEKYRAETLAWLDRHGMAVSRLVMHPAAMLADRQRDDVAAYKAAHYREFAGKKHFHPPLFIESDHRQAERIAKLSGHLSACPAASRCFSGNQ